MPRIHNAQSTRPQHFEWWHRLGVTVPVICAPMGGVAGGALAAAVSAAGALGTIGMGSSGSPTALTRELDAFTASGGGEIFGIGLVDWGVRRYPDMLDIAFEARPKLLSVSFGDFMADPVDAPWIARAKALGIATITQASNADEAVRAVDAGVTAIVARGLEAGGHGDPQHLQSELLDAMLEQIGDRVPVLAAGSIRDHADLARVLAQGAAGAWVGTAFTACEESLSSAENREILVRAGDGDTRVTREFDIAQGLPWPERFPERVITGTPVNAGMGIGSVTRVRSAAEAVASFRPWSASSATDGAAS